MKPGAKKNPTINKSNALFFYCSNCSYVRPDYKLEKQRPFMIRLQSLFFGTVRRGVEWSLRRKDITVNANRNGMSSTQPKSKASYVQLHVRQVVSS